MANLLQISRINVDSSNNPVKESNYNEEPPLPSECLTFAPELNNRLVGVANIFPTQSVQVEDRTDYGECEPIFSFDRKWFLVPASSSDPPIYTQSPTKTIISANLSYTSDSTGSGINLLDDMTCSVAGSSNIRFNWTKSGDSFNFSSILTIDLGSEESDTGGTVFGDVVEEVYTEGEFRIELDYTNLNPDENISLIIENALFLTDIQFKWILLEQTAKSSPIYTQSPQSDIVSASLSYDEESTSPSILLFDGDDDSVSCSVVGSSNIRFNWKKTNMNNGLKPGNLIEDI